ncbi:hypothetical protein [Singulisphaera sp. GP187]|uniref:hypothetical protein n=1 Tax=Singulisphaera sp. GP187 TaxID=1882752 RepID=UPI0011612E1B|nr:hypothetical protein [Singulisphaera sp. GP187]
MTKKRHDDRPERRRNRCRQLAVLGFLTLGSNLGCGRDMLRLPAGSDGTLLGPAPIPYSASTSGSATATAATTAGRKPAPIAPVAIKTDGGYASSLDDLFLATYRDSSTYGPHLTKSTTPRSSHGESPLPSGLLAASRESRVAPPDPITGQTAERPALFAQPAETHARQQSRGPAESVSKPTQIPLPQARVVTPKNQAPLSAPAVQGPMDLVSACGLTKIDLPKRGEPASVPNLKNEANKRTAIAMPISPVRAAKSLTESQPEVESPPPALSEAPSPPIAPIAVQSQSPAVSATATPSLTEPTPPVELPPTPTQPAELPAEPPTPAEPTSQPAAALELPAQADETPSQPPALAEMPSQSPGAVDLLADPPALPEMPGNPARPAEPPAAVELPSAPATLAELPSQSPALPADPSQSPPPAEMPDPLPPLAELANEPAVPTKTPKVENPGSPFEDAGTSPPTPSKPGSPPQADDLNAASAETKIPLPGQAGPQSSHGQTDATGPDEPPLPPLQIDPSVFGTSAELPPPLPLATPSPAVAANSKCPACEILRKQKESDHWATPTAKQTILCPSCLESPARAKAEPKPGHESHDLDSALKATNIAPPLRSAKPDH